MNTNTIPQMLREIAVRIGTHDMAAYVQLRAIANELDAPAADAVQARGIQEWADSPACAGLLLVLHRDHLAAIASEREHASKLRETFLRMQQEHAGSIAALQARINELEARQVPEGEVHFIQGGKLVGKIINIGSQPDTSKEQP